jgi:hypothetical protein
MQLVDDFYNEDGTLKGVSGDVGAYRREKPDKIEVVFTYHVDAAAVENIESLEALISKLQNDVDILTKYAASLKS